MAAPLLSRRKFVSHAPLAGVTFLALTTPELAKGANLHPFPPNTAPTESPREKVLRLADELKAAVKVVAPGTADWSFAFPDTEEKDDLLFLLAGVAVHGQ